MFTPTKEVSTILHSVNTRTTAWPQQNADPLMSTNPPLVPVSEHIRNVQYEHINASSLWYQDFSTGKTTPTVSVRLPDTAHRKEHHLAPFIEAIEPSRMKSQIRSTSLSGSTLPEYTCHGQNEDQNGYAPQPSNLGSHHQHRCADFPATRSPYSQGLHVPPWSSRQWNHPQYESASSRGRNGA